MAKRISLGRMSETWPALPREGLDALLMLERSLQNFIADDPAGLDLVEADARAWATLGARTSRCAAREPGRATAGSTVVVAVALALPPHVRKVHSR